MACWMDKRELLKETGFGGGNWEYLGAIPANPVFQDAYIHHWIATDVELIVQLLKKGLGELESTPNIQI